MSNDAINSVSNDANKAEKPKRKRKRFSDEAEILKAIDKCHENAARLKKEAKDWDRMADQSAALGAPNIIYRNEAQKRRDRARFYEESKAKTLGEKLSQLRTPLLFGDDASVPG